MPAEEPLMDAEELAAAGQRLREAIAGKTGGAKPQLAEVLALDVVAVGGTVPAEVHTELTRALVTGAAKANPRKNAELVVYQFGHQLKRLLDLAGVP